jgi:hypothetical protein
VIHNPRHTAALKAVNVGAILQQAKQISSVQRTYQTQSTLETSIPTLEKIRQAKGNINAIRFVLKGDLEVCKNLFKKALEEDDIVLQIQLSHAFFGIKWGHDDAKDFSCLTVDSLETFSYYPRDFELFTTVYNIVLGNNSDPREQRIFGYETFRLAAKQGYLPAFLEHTCAIWRLNTNNYGFAAKLRPFVGKGDKHLDYYFGKALKNGSSIGSELFYEGMHWINQSRGTKVIYPPIGVSFELFALHYPHSEVLPNKKYYEQDELRHVGETDVLAPSEEAWKMFVRDKLDRVKIASKESYVHDFNPAQIRSLVNMYDVTLKRTSSFVKSSNAGYEIQDSNGNKLHGFYIDSLIVYQGGEEMGAISVREDTLVIYHSFKNHKLQPVIQFLENVMKRSGSAYSAMAWLEHIRS